MRTTFCWIFLASVAVSVLAKPHGVILQGAVPASTVHTGYSGTVQTGYSGTVQNVGLTGTVHSVPVGSVQTTHLLVVPKTDDDDDDRNRPVIQQNTQTVVETKVDTDDVQRYTAPAEVHVSRPITRVSRPIVKVSEPEYRVQQPDVHVEAEPEVRIARPKIHVTQPVVKVTKPELHVSQPTVHVVKPQVRVDPGKLRVHKPTVHITKPEVHVSRQEYHVLEDTRVKVHDTDLTHYVHEAPVVRPSGEEQEVEVTKTNSHVEHAPDFVYHDTVHSDHVLADAAAVTRSIVHSSVVVGKPVASAQHYSGTGKKSIH